MQQKQVRIAQIFPDGSISGMTDMVLALRPAKKTNGFNDGWVAMAQNPLAELAQAKIGDQAMRVFLMLVATLDFENFLSVSQVELAKKLDMDKAALSRAMAKLVTEGVFIKGPKVGTRQTYRLNPSYGWKGSGISHKQALADRMKIANMKVAVNNGQPSEEPEDDKQEHLF